MLDPKQHSPAKYTVRLHFAEPKKVAAGQRVFDVSVQGTPVLSSFDIVARAGRSQKAYIEEFTGIEVKDTLKISLRKNGGELPPLLCGLEVRRE